MLFILSTEENLPKRTFRVANSHDTIATPADYAGGSAASLISRSAVKHA
jgi:hypothetical protein